MTKGWNAHYNILFDLFLSWVKIVKHDGLKWLQEHLLIAEVFALFFLQEFVWELSQRVDGIDDDMEIFVTSYPSKMLA